jgi:anaerobic magnesium-protoporphyrin IX monomethyl ester cyclase
MTKDFRDRGLIINERLEEYDGTTAVVRTEHLSADEVEFLRWRAERWMKLRHMPAALAHSPLFLLRNAPKMFAHTFRGSTHDRAVTSAVARHHESEPPASLAMLSG